MLGGRDRGEVLEDVLTCMAEVEHFICDAQEHISRVVDFQGCVVFRCMKLRRLLTELEKSCYSGV
ncbi:hypothetical protein O4444_05015 [Xylella fastidiosa subsp. pauca]|uniref:hypothetical protein n=1 Tax=Xylella fastidiosa TaxID=2371 RepID=UPI00249E1AA2|nr:hypothetical protein [Xylella fastidiosa]WGZ32957.1 hypothetical protein O4444_05015 [Xylella fastidiosa subsp. pauca]